MEAGTLVAMGMRSRDTLMARMVLTQDVPDGMDIDFEM